MKNILINIETEKLIDLRAATREPVFRNRNGRPCHVSKIYRLLFRGALDANGNRVKLSSVKTPTGWATSREAIARFIAQLTDPENPLPPSLQNTRRRQIEEAKQSLIAAGFRPRLQQRPGTHSH